MLYRSIAAALVAAFIAVPLTARADLWINFHNLRVITAQRGCHLENSSDSTKRSTLRCGPYEMTNKPHFTTYTEAWGRKTDDPRYGGCATQAWTIALPPATHQFDISVQNSDRSPIVCKYNWVNNNTVDVFFFDKIPGTPLRFHVTGLSDAEVARFAMYGSGLCGMASANERTTGQCRAAGDLSFALQNNNGAMTYPCKVKVSPVYRVILPPVWSVQVLSNDGRCTIARRDDYTYSVHIKS
jgi:hypothetical protein